MATRNIKPTPVPSGKTWDQLTKNQKAALSKSDIRRANKALEDSNGDLPIGWSKNSSNHIEINGVKHVWHHDVKRGQMQLIPKDLHDASQVGSNEGFNHIGHASWHISY